MGLVTIVRVCEVKKPISRPKKKQKKPHVEEQPVVKKEKTTEGKKPEKKSIDEDVKEVKKFEPISPDNDYERHTQLYKEAMKSYEGPRLSETAYSYSTEEKKQKDFDWGAEIMTYKERREYVRKVQMNALMGGRHNHIDPEEERNYAYWKWARKENEQMSFQLYDGVFNT